MDVDTKYRVSMLERAFRPVLLSESAKLIAAHTTASVEQATMNGEDHAGAWLITSPDLEKPEVYTDDALIEFGAKLRKIFN